MPMLVAVIIHIENFEHLNTGSDIRNLLNIVLRFPTLGIFC